MNTEDEEGKKKTKTLIVAAGKKMLSEYIEIFKGANLE